MLDGDLVCKCVVVNMYLGTPVCDKEKPAAFYVEDLEGAPCALLLGSHGDGILLILFPLCVKCGTATPAKIGIPYFCRREACFMPRGAG